MNNNPFIPGVSDDPFKDMPAGTLPNPPSNIPEAPAAGDAVAALSPFKEAQDVDSIEANLMIDRQMKLYIPNRHLYPDHEFRIINTIPQEIADATNKGFRPVTDESLAGLFSDLIAGTDKEGKPFRPMLVARPRRIGDIVRRQTLQKLASIYAGMDPSNKDMGGKYTDNVGPRDGTSAKFDGSVFRVRVY